MNPNEIINYATYPIDKQNDARRQQTINKVRAKLADDGCAVLPNFISTQGLNLLLEQALERKDQAYYSPEKNCNVYFNSGDKNYPQDHPRNLFLERSNGFISADLFTPKTAAYQFYHWLPLRQFLADCLVKDELFIYADPVSNMIVNLAKPGQQFNWHFDTNEFTITVLLQAASSGGHFEYVPNLRSKDDECYDEVKKVLEGDRSRVTRLKLNAGDLQIFLGRFSLHQVTKNTGDNERLLLIMSFTQKPGVIGSVHRVQELYGKVTQEHYNNEKNRVRADKLLD